MKKLKKAENGRTLEVHHEKPANEYQSVIKQQQL